jgi:hydroxymethylglutaryl-CoA synthase
MQLFPTNRTVLGVDNVNACYGGTAALLNSIAWVESSFWDQRLALVVCTDIALYDDVPARPSGGCGAVAIVVGPDAVITLEPGLFSHFAHAWDVYKPLASFAPVANGRDSIAQYLECLDGCLARAGGPQAFDFACVHAPFVNMARKAAVKLQAFDASPRDDFFTAKVEPSLTLCEEVGNAFTASLFFAVASLLEARDCSGLRLACFSYGSGAASTLFFARVGDASEIRSKLGIGARLRARSERSVEGYEQCAARARKAFAGGEFTPESDSDWLWPGQWTLTGIDPKGLRSYARLPVGE